MPREHQVVHLLNTARAACRVPEPKMVLRNKKLRQAGFQAFSGRLYGPPQNAPIVGAMAIFGCAVPGVDADVVNTIRFYGQMVGPGPAERYRVFDVDPQARPIAKTRVTAFQLLEMVLENFFHPDLIQRAKFIESFESVELASDYLAFRTSYTTDIFYPAAANPAQADRDGGLQTTTSIAQNVFRPVADLVEASRIEAARLGIDIETRAIHQAIKSPPPPPLRPINSLARQTSTRRRREKGRPSSRSAGPSNDHQPTSKTNP